LKLRGLQVTGTNAFRILPHKAGTFWLGSSADSPEARIFSI
jgi:hypothetical protein